MSESFSHPTWKRRSFHTAIVGQPWFRVPVLGGQLKPALQIESNAHQIPFPFHLVEPPQQKLPKPQHVLDDPKGRFDGGFPFRIQRSAGFRAKPVSHLGHRIVSRRRIGVRRAASGTWRGSRCVDGYGVIRAFRLAFTLRALQYPASANRFSALPSMAS